MVRRELMVRGGPRGFALTIVFHHHWRSDMVAGLPTPFCARPDTSILYPVAK